MQSQGKNLGANDAMAVGKKAPSSRMPHSVTPNLSTPAESDNSDAMISDLDSDMEPDQLIPTYLKIKSRIFEHNPDLLQAKPAKAKGSKRRGLQPVPAPRESAAARKLLSQLKKIESDALFDRDEAEALWPAKRMELARELATKLKSPPLTSDTQDDSQNGDEKSGHVKSGDVIGMNANDDISSAEEDDSDRSLLGDMFGAIPDEPSASRKNAMASTDNHDVTLRDFGKQTGLTPRRILEEAVRARLVVIRIPFLNIWLIDSRHPKAKIVFKLVSQTTYACRHSVSITRRKDHPPFVQDIPGVRCDAKSDRVVYTATKIAAVSEQQSEGFISTVALFGLFSTSTKEEKVCLRLPAVWRDLYRELVEQEQTGIDAADRSAIKQFRTIIQDQVEQEEADGVVLTSRFKQRNQGTSTPPIKSGPSLKPSLVGLDSLKDLWFQKSSTSAFQHMLSIRNTLPVLQYRHYILSTIDKHQVTIICGETGCGKSTQIPSFLLEHELSKGMPCKIFCTEPRRISAISLAQRVSEELGEGPKDLGTPRSLVGYAIRLESKTSAQTRLVYATVGVVLRMLESSQRLEDVTHLIIDEVHERR